jgi:CTD kinase subunit alpha
MTQVGEGTFGKVYKARNNTTNAIVALKRVRMEAEKDGFPVTAMREIKLLQSLRHDNVVRLHEMMVSNGLFYYLSLRHLLIHETRIRLHGVPVHGP